MDIYSRLSLTEIIYIYYICKYIKKKSIILCEIYMLWNQQPSTFMWMPYNRALLLSVPGCVYIWNIFQVTVGEEIWVNDCQNVISHISVMLITFMWMILTASNRKWMARFCSWTNKVFWQPNILGEIIWISTSLFWYTEHRPNNASRWIWIGLC